MKRRTFIGLLGATAAWPLASHAQQPVMPLVGFVHSQLADTYGDRLRAFRPGGGAYPRLAVACFQCQYPQRDRRRSPRSGNIASTRLLSLPIHSFRFVVSKLSPW